ncbi:MAG: PA14 domain-containing protein [Chitinivibrionales bacterium]|nr:PA14 domain-containing protein [Chitinivibrionales bacterium]
MNSLMRYGAIAILSVCPSLFANMPVDAPAPIAGGQGYGIALYDDFDNPTKTVDLNNTCAPGYNFYVRLPGFYGGGAASGVSAANGVLTLAGGGGWDVCTYPLCQSATKGFKHGYFEARMRFDPTLGPNTNSWPAFWLFSVSHSLLLNVSHWTELDIFEAYTGGQGDPFNGTFYGTAHDWVGLLTNWANASNSFPVPTGTDFNQWHTYGFLWEADTVGGTGSFKWYFDDQLLSEQRYSRDGLPSPVVTDAPAGTFWIAEKENPDMGMLLILGSCTGWPLDVDGVRIWQKGIDTKTPTMNPIGGFYNDSVQVTMTTTAAGVTIHYTTDGSNPTKNSLTYSSAAKPVFKTNTVLKARGYTASDSSNLVSATYNILSRIAKPSGSGLQYKYYEYDGAAWTALHDLTQLTPKASGTTDSFGIDRRLRNYKFAMHFSGAISIPADGDYTFTVNADAGARFYISNNLVVNNDGAHSSSTSASGTVSLKTGYYAVSLDYFKDSTLAGGRLAPGLSVYYQSATIAKTKVTKSMLWSDPSAVTWFGTRKSALDNPLSFTINKDVVAVSVGFTDPYRLELVKLSGAVVMAWNGARAATYRVNRKQLPAGLYMLRATDAAGRKFAKLLTWY